MAEGPSNSSTFNDYNARLQSSALNATRKAASLPTDIGFHKSLDHDLVQEVDAVAERILSMTNGLLALVSTAKGTQSKGKAKLQSRDEVVDDFPSLVVDLMDQLLENADICIDNLSGKNKAPMITVNPQAAQHLTEKKPTRNTTTQSSRNSAVIQHAAHIPKPQLTFNHRPDNSDSPWYPTLSHKYNAKVPLGHVYNDTVTQSGSSLVSNHPYRYEITHLNYPPRMFVPSTPIQPSPLEDSSATWISETSQFQSMLSKIRQATELAIDLEHHSYRSYAGFLCLMQISNREEDWIVDLLALRDEVEALNEVFTDPSIVKVFHGAESDIVWLQQDFNLYIVNLFDTFHASKLLDFPRHGLANLLEMYCDFTPDKRYQLADWRIRPLPEDMLQYARSDTHFLLYIYDNLRNALIDKSKSRSGSPTSAQPYSGGLPSSNQSEIKGATRFLDEALARSAETSLRVFTKEPYDMEEGSGVGGWDTLAKRWNKIALTAGGPGVGVGSMQREVYKSIHWWREKIAREEDESTRYILQNHFLFLIAEQPPADMASLLRVFKSSVPPVIKRRGKELLSVIKEAVKRGLPFAPPVAGQQSAASTFGISSQEPTSEPTQEIASEGQKQSPDIWSTNPAASKPLSTLFVAPVPKSVSLPQFSVGVSALFGVKQVPATVPYDQSSNASSTRPNFEAVISKINRSLVLAPTLPPVAAMTPAASENTLQTSSISPQVVEAETGMQVDVEIAYTPASQRPTKPQPSALQETDALVVVGQPRQKRKRKATSKPADDLKEKVEETVEPFDFSTVPNILDNDDTTIQQDDSNKRRKKQKRDRKTAGPFYGDFPAPPKAHSEVRSGNQSFTFTK